MSDQLLCLQKKENSSKMWKSARDPAGKGKLDIQENKNSGVQLN
jgi:hypothetical protein